MVPVLVTFAVLDDLAVAVDANAIDDGFAITSIHLTLKAKIPGADQARFEELAGKAKTGCPVSKVLNTKITLDARLEP